MCCFVAFSPCLSEVHTKKVRKVPPGLPSSVSDNMPFFFYYFGSMVLLLFRVCAGEEKAPACLESLSWFCCRKKNKKTWSCGRAARFCKFVEMTMTLLSEPSWTQTAASFLLLFLFLGSQLEEIYCSKSTEMYWYKCCSFFSKWLTAQSW